VGIMKRMRRLIREYKAFVKFKERTIARSAPKKRPVSGRCSKCKMHNSLCMCDTRTEYLGVLGDPLKHTIVDLEMEQIVKELASE